MLPSMPAADLLNEPKGRPGKDGAEDLLLVMEEWEGVVANAISPRDADTVPAVGTAVVDMVSLDVGGTATDAGAAVLVCSVVGGGVHWR